jgi:glucose 1-dehydrogenase
MVKDGIHGSIVNISSVLQTVTAPNLTHYSVTKAGVGMLTKQMALELAPENIRVNGVAPGLISTDMNSKDLANNQFKDLILNDIPLGKIGMPEDIAGSVVFLCSNQEAGLITGTTIFIDGGRSLR